MLRIMSLNAGSVIDPGWEERRHEVVAWIDRVDPDIVCLQEMGESATLASTGDWVAEQASADWHHVFGGHEIPAAFVPDPPMLFGSSVLSRWPIEHHTTHRLPVDDDALTDDDPLPAVMPWELLQVRTAGLDIFSTHLAAAPNHGLHRQAQVAAIDDIVRRSRGDSDRIEFGSKRTTMPPILCGDMNAEPESDEMRFLRGMTALNRRTTFWQDAWLVAGDGTAGLTQDWRTHPLAARLNVHRKRIDYVYVGDPFMREGKAGRVLSARVICDETITGVQASDHMGLLVEIEWPQRPD